MSNNLDTESIDEIINTNMELAELRSLRDNIRGYIGQADEKAKGIAELCTVDFLKKELYKLYLKCISPNIDYPEAPKDYELMNCRTKEHIEYEIKICKEILLKKYEIINKMLIIAK